MSHTQAKVEMEENLRRLFPAISFWIRALQAGEIPVNRGESSIRLIHKLHHCYSHSTMEQHASLWITSLQGCNNGLLSIRKDATEHTRCIGNGLDV